MIQYLIFLISPNNNVLEFESIQESYATYFPEKRNVLEYYNYFYIPEYQDVLEYTIITLHGIFNIFTLNNIVIQCDPMTCPIDVTTALFFCRFNSNSV